MTRAEDVLRLHPVLGQLDDESIVRLAEQSRWEDFADGEVLAPYGEPTGITHVIAEGQVLVKLRALHGAELVLRVIGPGLDIGALAVIDGGTQPTEYVAEGPVRVVGVDGAAIRAELMHRPDLLLYTASRVADQVRLLAAGMSDLAFLDVRRRLAKLVLGEEESAGGVVRLAAHQAAAASRLGVTRQTFNRALGELARRRWIEADGADVRVLDRSALARYVTS